MHFGPIQADGPQFEHARLLSQQEHLDEQVLQLGQERAPKRGQRIMIGMQIACDEAKRHCLIGSSLNLARAEYPGRIPIEQQAQQHFGSVGFPTACPILGIQRREVQLSHTVYHKASEMVRGQAVTQPHCQFQRLLVVHGFESSTHAHQYTITGQPYLLLSDKLLGHPLLFLHFSIGEYLIVWQQVSSYYA